MARLELLPEPLSLAPFSVQDALLLGVTKGRLRSRDLSIPFRGVRCDPALARDFETRWDTYASKMPPGHFFSHTTAAALHGIPLPWLEPVPRLHVSVFEPARAPRGQRIAGHQLASLDMLRDAVEERSGQRGSVRLRNALSLMRVGAESPKETELRLLLHRAGLPEPELNTEILSRCGVWIARGDIVYRWFKVLVEYDGVQHETDRDQYVRDVERLESLTRAGWRTIRVLKEHLGPAPDDVIARVAKALRARGWYP